MRELGLSTISTSTNRFRQKHKSEDYLHCVAASKSVIFRPHLELLQHAKGRAAKLGDLVSNGNRPGTEDLSLHEARLLHFFKSLSDHLLACTAELTGEVVEANGSFLQVPQD